MSSARILVTCLLISTALLLDAQTKHALFLGNSYTAVNDLPSLTAEVADSMGDTLIYDSNTPGGYTLQGHSSNANSISKISEGTWDFVILQEQSQRPSFPDAQVEQEVFPYAEILDTTISFYNDCAETVFYMTWGRENGDAGNCATWPPVCTYEGMDSLLALRYAQMAEMNLALLSPVGAVWHEIRDNYPEIGLYAGDGSHPSAAGTYAAAVTFYTILFREDPSLIPFDYTLDALVAANIRSAVHDVVFEDFSQWHVGEYDLSADFDYEQIGPYTYEFTSTSSNYTGLEWSMGDSQEEVNTIIFPGPGDYFISLSAYNDCDTMWSSQMISIPVSPNSIEENQWGNELRINSPVGDFLVLRSSIHGFELSIIDLAGRLVKQRSAGFDTDWNISNLPSGVYILRGIDKQGHVLKSPFQKL